MGDGLMLAFNENDKRDLDYIIINAVRGYFERRVEAKMKHDLRDNLLRGEEIF